MGYSVASLAALLATAGLVAHAPLARADALDIGKFSGDFAACEIVISSQAKETTAIAADEVAKTTANFVCGQADLGDMPVRKAATEAARKVAVLGARAVAQVSVNCFASGRSNIMVGGRSIAEAEAVSLASEFARNIKEIKICSNCKEVATLVAEEFEDLFVSAVAEAMVSLKVATSQSTRLTAVSAFEKAVSEVFVVDYTKILVSTRTDAAEEGCKPASPPPAKPMSGDIMKVKCDKSEPVADRGKCFGTDIDTPKVCASKDYLCVTKGPAFASCRLNGVPLDDTWEGLVFECT